MSVFVAGPVAWNQLVYLDVLPRAEPHTVFARGHVDTVGGTSAGKALNLRSLGAEVTLRTVVGRDVHARRVLDVLDGAGVDTIAELGTVTERHLNLMDPVGGRVSVYLDLPELTEVRHAERTTTALAGAEVAVLDLAEHVRPLLGSRTHDVPVWCDLHDYDGTAEYHRDFVAAASVLFLNDDGMPDPRPFMVDRVAAGARLVVLTQGARGATALCAETGWHQVPAEPVPAIVDTNGAGDAFFAGFLIADLAGADVPSALRAGARQAARCLGSPNLAPPATTRG